MTIGLFHGAKAKRGRCDRGVIVTFILLLTAGLIVLYAASYYNAQDKGSPLSEVLSQLMGIGLGAAGMAVVLRIDYRILQKTVFSSTLLCASIVLLILVATPGIGRFVNGSRR